ncbi:long-chain-fatty-acid--CoA ligase [Prosthecodimorpha staleyi]|nr:long-chain fatty acid--CoA ligase [Prosthecodimorpha staleyi]
MNEGGGMQSGAGRGFDDLGIEPGPVQAALDEAVARFGPRPAVDFLGRRWSFAEIGALVDRATRGFQALGVRRGVRVGLCLPNTPYSVVCYFAVLKAGGTVVNFNPLYVERELKHQVVDSGTTIMVTVDLNLIYPKVAALLGPGGLEKIVVCRLAAALPFPQRLLFPIVKRKEIAHPPQDADHVPFERLIASPGAAPVTIDPGADVAVLQYTGGTTGVPKGAMLTHANLSAQTEQLRRVVPGARPGEERMLMALPLFHCFAMAVGMLLAVRIGCEMILLPRFDLAQVIATIRKKKPTLFPGVPTIYTALNAAAAKGHVDFGSLRYCISGGAPLPAEVMREFEHLSGCRLVEGYGLTEASPVVAVNPLDLPGKPGSIGLPLEGTRIEIRAPEDGRPLPVGEKGEICVIGPQVMAGYWQRPDETKDVFHGRALRTGDIGYMDEDGYTFIVDRIKDVILCSGFNVYPRAIEEALYQHPAVAEAIAIGIPDGYRGQAPKAFVKLKDGAAATPAELAEFLTDYLSRIELPREIEIRASLPKTMIGKLSKKELVAEEQAKADARLAAGGGVETDGRRDAAPGRGETRT